MSAPVNNGTAVGSFSILVRPVDRTGRLREELWDAVRSVLLTDDVTSQDWLVTVHDGGGAVVASRRFERKLRADQARDGLALVARAADDLTTFDWQAHLGGPSA